MSIETDLKIDNIFQIFTIGDIHGCNNLLKKIHKKILNKSEKVKGNKILIYLGDYITEVLKLKRPLTPSSTSSLRILNVFFLGVTTIKCF